MAKRQINRLGAGIQVLDERDWLLMLAIIDQAFDSVGQDSDGEIRTVGDGTVTINTTSGDVFIDDAL